MAAKRLPLFLAFGAMLISTGLSEAKSVNNDSANITGEEEHYHIRELPEPIGFAFSGEGTTGGEGGEEVTVTNGQQLLRFATSDEPYVINVVDTVEIVVGIGDFIETNGEYHLGSNTTLRGAGTSATIKYGGFRVSEAENVIIQNLNFDGTFQGYDEDLDGIDCADVPDGAHRYKNGPCLESGDKAPTDNALEITEGSERVWITQNSFKRYSDEIMSVKREASYVTISWNRFDDKITGADGMMILIGSGDDRTENRGRLRTTLHHNYMASRSRHPRARFGNLHIFNNYYHNIGFYGISGTTEAETLVESNYFEDVSNSWFINGDGQTPGFLVARDNVFVDADSGPTSGELGEEVADPAIFYEYTTDDPESVPDMVLEGSGAAGAGDFTGQIMPAPGIPEPKYPTGSSDESLRPDLSWSEAIFATQYDLQVREGVSEDAPVTLDTTVATTEFKYPGDLAQLEGDKTYFWRVRAFNESATGRWSEFEYFTTETSTSVNHGDSSSLPGEFRLEDNYPNPFNPVTTISYKLPELAEVDLRVFDVTGREITVLASEQQSANEYTITFNADEHQLASGVYLYRLKAVPVSGSGETKFRKTGKMNLAK